MNSIFFFVSGETAVQYKIILTNRSKTDHAGDLQTNRNMRLLILHPFCIFYLKFRFGRQSSGLSANLSLETNAWRRQDFLPVAAQPAGLPATHLSHKFTKSG